MGPIKTPGAHGCLPPVVAQAAGPARDHTRAPSQAMELAGAATGAGDETVPSFESMLSQSNTVFCVLAAPAGIVLYVSPNSAAVLGIEPTALLGCVRARAMAGGGPRGRRRGAAAGTSWPLGSSARPADRSAALRARYLTRHGGACCGVAPIRLPRALRRGAHATRICIALTKQLPRRRRTLASLGDDVLRAADCGIVTNALATACAAPPDSPPEPAAARRRVSGGAPDAPDTWRWTEAKARRIALNLAASGARTPSLTPRPP